MFTQRFLWALVGGILSLLLAYFGSWYFGLSLLLITLAWTVIRARLLKGLDEEKLRTADGTVLIIVGAIFIAILMFC